MSFYDEIAAGLGTFSAGAIAAAYAARGSFAAYSFLFGGGFSQVYYHLDETTTGPGRTPALEITDGTTTTVRIPDGFTAQTTPGPYQFTWLPTASSDTRDPSGTITTSAMPQLVLPGGYTVGTRTPDLQPADQWSNINVWWDDNIQQSRVPIDYPPGARLVIIPAGV